MSSKTALSAPSAEKKSAESRGGVEMPDAFRIFLAAILFEGSALAGDGFHQVQYEIGLDVSQSVHQPCDVKGERNCNRLVYRIGRGLRSNLLVGASIQFVLSGCFAESGDSQRRTGVSERPSQT